MAKQKLVVTGEIVLPETTDIFEATDKARSARTILEQAQKEIQKTFPDFKFNFSVAQVRAEGSGRPGRKSAADIAAAKAAEEAAKLAAENTAAAPAGNGSGKPAGAPAA